ncbi:pre-mycofactocin synthase MftD [Phytoactinopolyspora endophytica]|uniref:pre-mycofactocin synthase MftD n=1 Tax=Phytoactinopolyspora endophytica TaxID=1642495 RepID=UPI00101CAC79|nr:pre-mycofactocin synthase MftD [Phytoactinopolyspora endophytica]
MSDAWFESVAEAQRRAKRRLPKSVYMALIAGSERGSTLSGNVEAFGELGFAPHVVGQHDKRELATTVLGQRLELPVILSPTGVQAVHPDGETAVARAAANRGTAMGLSSFASRPVEEVVEANPQTLFQIYWCGTRDAMLHRLERARRAGAVGVIATLDWSFSHGRDWGSPRIPNAMNLRTILRHLPEVAPPGRWRYLKSYAKTLRPPELSVPNMALPGGSAPGFFDAYGEWMQTPKPTWEDLRWLREQWDGPFVVKGVCRIDDARRAADIGATAMSVSNHGGNNLDGTPAAIRVLPAVVDAVGDQIEVLMDGGVRRGADVVKALAMGARAVLIGRAYLWGMAAEGQTGVENVLDILRNGIDSALMGLGRSSIAELSRDDLVIPSGFCWSLGGDDGHRVYTP